jgi:hypothetical protein
VIRLGLRLAVSGGREAITRPAVLAAAGLGVGTFPLLRRITGPDTARNE